MYNIGTKFEGGDTMYSVTWEDYASAAAALNCAHPAAYPVNIVSMETKDFYIIITCDDDSIWKYSTLGGEITQM